MISLIVGLVIIAIMGFLPSLILVFLFNKFIYPAYFIPKKSALIGTVIGFLVSLVLGYIGLGILGAYVIICLISSAITSLMFFAYKYFKYKSSSNNNA
ncbi:hypothetical protein [Rheinheimera oceanensis]|uniref:hypothetical protein n=1 Tax=Rheinheimera oceanensis TaxID=2817449 RepID=UPI001BFE273A|nr:hypothetical protein [Rheinheimera oceanensis]